MLLAKMETLLTPTQLLYLAGGAIAVALVVLALRRRGSKTPRR